MARKNRKNPKRNALATARGIAGVERKEALAAGGQQALIWRSGGLKASVTTDRRKKADRNACRGSATY